MALVSIQLRIQWVLRLRIRGALTPIFRMISWLYLYREHHGDVASIVAFTRIHNIPGQNTDPALPILITVS